MSGVRGARCALLSAPLARVWQSLPRALRVPPASSGSRISTFIARNSAGFSLLRSLLWSLLWSLLSSLLSALLFSSLPRLCSRLFSLLLILPSVSRLGSRLCLASASAPFLSLSSVLLSSTYVSPLRLCLSSVACDHNIFIFRNSHFKCSGSPQKQFKSLA